MERVAVELVADPRQVAPLPSLFSLWRGEGVVAGNCSDGGWPNISTPPLNSTQGEGEQGRGGSRMSSSCLHPDPRRIGYFLLRVGCFLWRVGCFLRRVGCFLGELAVF